MSTIGSPVTPRPPGAEPTEPERRAAAELLPMIWGIHISRSVYVAAELGIADLLANGPVSSQDLRRATGTHEPSLYRVLRLLAGLGVLEETDPRCFSLTLLGDRLRTDAPACMRSWATFLEGLGGVRPFEHILETVRTGKPGLEAALETDLFSFLAQHPRQAAAFDAAMAERTASFAPSLARTYDFSEIRTLVDVGGGNGTLLAGILRHHPHLQGTLFEVPDVASRAGVVLDAADAGDRCEVLAGDFFETVPAGADCYLVANVLHDWDDTRAIAILRNCREAMARAGRVLVVERLITDDLSRSVPTLLSDINMLVLSGGLERTNTEYRGLMEAAGLRMSTVQPLTFPYGVIEALTG